MSASAASRPEMIGTLDFNLRLIRYRPWTFALHSLLAILGFSLQVVPGWVVKQVFDGISGQAAHSLFSGWNLWGWIGLYLAVEIARLFIALGSEWYGWSFRLLCSALLRSNLFAAILRRPGDRPLPVSTGEAIHRFGSDVGEVTDFPLWFPDQVGKWIAAAVAVVIMARINWQITLIIFLPLFGVIAITRLAWGRILRYNRLAAEAGDRVSGFLGETLASVQALKLADAEAHAAAHFARLVERRNRYQVREAFFREFLDLMNNSVVTFGVGVMLLMAGAAITAGRFTVGDFALFVSYLWFTTQVPSELGTFYGDFKTQEVSINRLLEMIRPERAAALTAVHPVYSDGALPAVALPRLSPGERLHTLEVRELSCEHRPGENGQSRGLSAVSFKLERGSFTVVTGRVGSGKSTLLRALTGLLPRSAGEILWNGVPVSDPAAFFRPPRCAYTAQVPLLFSDTLRENILLGLPENEVDLPGALYLSVFEGDVAGFEHGLETLVGPKGLRLSGGQVQRAAAARMFVRAPDLLVFDDLSSALDVETEHEMWRRLDQLRQDGTGPTCLVVSHRRAVLRRADQILVLKDGAVQACCRLEELLETDPEMRRLWQAQAGAEL